MKSILILALITFSSLALAVEPGSTAGGYVGGAVGGMAGGYGMAGGMVGGYAGGFAAGYLPPEVVHQCEELGLFRAGTEFKNDQLVNCKKKSEDSIECSDGVFARTDDFFDKVSSFFKNEKKEAAKNEKMSKNCQMLGFVVVNKLAQCTKENSLEIHCPNGVYKNSKEVAEVERSNVKEESAPKETKKFIKSSKQ